jgi:DNA-binding FadR family transcriptional regulator
MAGLEELRGALNGIVATIDDPAAGGRADHDFHSALVAMARSETLATLYAAIGNLVLRSHGDRRASVFGTPDGRNYLIDHHRSILEAVAAGDPDQADAVLREHFAIGDEYRRRDVATRPNPAMEGMTA